MGDARVAALLAEFGAPSDVDVDIDGRDPILASKFPVGEAAAVAVGAGAAIAAQIWRDRTGEDQSVRVGVDAAAVSLISFLLQRVDDATEPPDMQRRNLVLTALYQARDGRWIHLHGGFPHLAASTRSVLGVADDADREAIARAVRSHDASELEDALADAGLCAAMVRTGAEWDEHPQGRALAGHGRVVVTKLAGGEPRPAGSGARPLSGTRVLDLTRVLAGPTVGRTLAEHGAEVLLVNSPRLPNVGGFVMDTSHGKRSALVDLDTADGAAKLRALVSGADVFVQGYRPDAVARRGFGAEALAGAHTGLVYVDVSCYGDAGPWRGRAGWEQMAESATGIAAAQGEPDRPRLVPAAPCDYITGYLGALGAMAALRRRAAEGGSYKVSVSLCRTGMWIRALGANLDPTGATGLGDWRSRTAETATKFGRLRHLLPVAEMSRTAPHWDLPPAPIGTHAAEWSDG
jgi:crotonobetainyl-CoA:carnitine CoA-transferase CaiB-like acyl-CoA transferase